MKDLTHKDYQRYSRHIIMPEVGVEGQKKLKNARVLVIGAGGLGSPIAMYLAAAGIGTIGLVDFDVVDESNLQRQIIHSTEYIGRQKIESASQRLKGINPEIEVITYNDSLRSDNALQIMEGYDVVCDGTDNFQTRYLVNDACVLLGIPNVYGSIFQFEGQVSVFDAKRGPCYRCLYANPPPPGLVPSCAEGGVFGVLPGTIGTLQATEIIKLILGIGEPLIGRLMLYDALDMSFRELKLKKNPDCKVCGENPEVTELIDYDEFCGVSSKDAELVENIDVRELEELRRKGEKHVLIDVRNPTELQIGRIEGSILIPERLIEERIHEHDIAKDDLIILQCKTGIRSARALVKLKRMGYTNVKNLHGGINAWARLVDPKIPLY